MYGRFQHRFGKNILVQIRFYADCDTGGNKKGLVLGAYDGCNPGDFILTPTASKFNDETDGKLAEILKGSGVSRGKAQVVTNISTEFAAVAVAGLGSREAGYDDLELMDECKENIRGAAGIGSRAIQDLGISNIFVEGFSNSEAAAEGSLLAVWKYQEFRTREKTPTARVEMFEGQDREGWQRGVIKADCQNVARQLEESPGNMMKPSLFCQKAIDILCSCGVQVDVRDHEWMERNHMKAMMSVGKNSCEPPLVLELGFCTANYTDKPVAFVGKGVTFDTGGLFLKDCKGMPESRAEMAGAAVLVGVFKGAAVMNLPMNITALIPLCENMLGGMSVKPGDVYNVGGKSVCVQDTDNEGRVIMAEPLVHCKETKPCLVVDIATLSKGTVKGLGAGATAVFTTSNEVWKELSRAGADTGDRVWRLPMWKVFKDKVTNFNEVDVHNVGEGPGGDPCLGAAFLSEFAPPDVDFVQMDIMGTGMEAPDTGFPYLRPGYMSGRPVRTVLQFLYQMACPHERGDDCGP